MKYYGTPIWADLENKNQRKKAKRAKKLLKSSDQSDDDVLSDDEEDSDMEEGPELFQQTGSFLADSSRISSATSSLPKNLLDIKVCTDANKEDPDKVTLFRILNLRLFLNSQ